MYMEAYGSVGSWADSIMKRSVEGAIGRKIAKEDAKEALSMQGVSPSEGEGGSPVATPQAETKPQANNIDDELKQRDKAIGSLQKKVANWQAKAQYQKSLATLYQKELLKNKKAELVGGK